MRTRILAVLVVVLCPLAAFGQSGDLRKVVALFRHGIRAPLQSFADHAGEHSAKPWPGFDAWKVKPDANNKKDWGFLTIQGYAAVKALGQYYGRTYRNSFKGDFSVFLWADVDERTKQTAMALRDGFNKNVEIKWLPAGDSDLLFHPYKAGCGRPMPDLLRAISGYIDRNADAWWTQDAPATDQILDTLGCPSGNPCRLDRVKERVCPCPTKTDKCGADSCDGPIFWKGKYSYASSASEAFLLEYTNNMADTDVGWNSVDPPNTKHSSKMATMLRLHKRYFDGTQRSLYLSRIGGSNLVREIQDTINGETGTCRRSPDVKFAGLVGHDTNIANVATLLGLFWTYDGTPLAGFPDGDLLPAGALVFELRNIGGADYVQIAYITQSPEQMRAAKDDAIRVRVGCTRIDRRFDADCLLPLDEFNLIAKIGVDPAFQSKCSGGKMSCRGW